MMQITRRSFLGGVLAVAAATAVPKALWGDIPTLWGDFWHDDAPALNAFLQGKPFRVEQAGLVEADGVLKNGLFRCKGQLTLTRSRVFITHCQFDFHLDREVEALMTIEGGGQRTLEWSHLNVARESVEPKCALFFPLCEPP